MASSVLMIMHIVFHQNLTWNSVVLVATWSLLAFLNKKWKIMERIALLFTRFPVYFDIESKCKLHV